MIGLSSILTAEDGQRYMVVGVHRGDTIKAIALSFVRVPNGMTAMDLGRKFKHQPTRADAFHAEFLVQ